MTAPNETGRSAPSDTIKGEHTNEIGALQAIVAQGLIQGDDWGVRLP